MVLEQVYPLSNLFACCLVSLEHCIVVLSCIVGLANNLIPCASRVYYVISTSHLADYKKKE